MGTLNPELVRESIHAINSELYFGLIKTLCGIHVDVTENWRPCL
jgi:hypothetical protein